MLLIIKGSAADAFAAAKARGIPLTGAHGNRLGHVAAACSHAHTKKVVEWFTSDVGQTPYKVGSLLWYKFEPHEERAHQ